MVSLWVTDSFERKDRERDQLAELLTFLYKSRNNFLSQVQIIKGYVDYAGYSVLIFCLKM